MLVEEFQDGCIVHDHLWCVNGVILAISESPYCWKLSINFLIKRIYGFRRRCWLKNSKMAVKCMAIFDVWIGCFLLFLSNPLCQKTSSFCSREYMVWKEMVVEKFKYGYLVHGHHWWVKGVILAISESPFCRKLFIKFLIKRKYGLKEDVGWRIPRWLFSAWSSLMCKWGDITYFWDSILSEAFHLVILF